MKKNINITFIVHNLNPGGAERLAVDMTLNLRKSFQISLICLDEPGTWANGLRKKNINVVPLYRERGIDIHVPYLIAKYTKKFNTDIIHAHQTTPWFYSALSRIFNPKPYLLFEEHGRFYPEQNNTKKKIINKAFINQLTHKIVAVSQDIKKRLVMYEGIPENKIQVIYNGIKIQDVNIDHLKELSRKKLNLNENDFIVGCVGRLDPIKNIPMLIKGIEIAKDKIPNIKCVIIGDGPELAKLKKIIAEKNLKENIILTGYRKDASKLVSAFDIFALTSLSEGISMAMLEAMSVSVPCIATKVGGNVELIENNVCGWLVETEDFKSLAGLLIKLYQNKSMLKKIGKQATKQVITKFFFNSMIEEYKNVYLELLQ